MSKTKKFLFVLLIISISSAPIFSSTAKLPVGSVNNWKFLDNDVYYANLLKSVFDNKGIDESWALYDEFVASLAYSGYSQWEKEISMARACLIMGRYCVQVSPKRKSLAEQFMNGADSLIASAKNNGAPVSTIGVVEALADSFWYLVNGSVSKGMSFTKLVDKLWEEYPEDFSVLLMKADRMLHSPGIAGGNWKKGFELFQEAEIIMEKNGCSIWDRFTIYSGLAVGYDKKKDKILSLYYAQLADSIYTADENVDKIIAKYSK